MEQHITYTIAAILTLCVFSFLWRDNPFYKFAEHLVVGVSAGYFAVIIVTTSLLPKLVDPIKRVLTGTSTTFLDPLVFVPLVVGLLLFARFIPKYGWVARIPIAYILGVGSGAAVPLVLQTNVIQQIYPTMTLFLPGASAGVGPFLNSLLVIVGVLCGIAYFFFSARHVGVLGGMSKVGIWTLMIGFGASFGYTVMSRISLLYGRVDFLVFDWAKPLVRAIFG
jgi:predicted small secreted protein